MEREVGLTFLVPGAGFSGGDPSSRARRPLFDGLEADEPREDPESTEIAQIVCTHTYLHIYIFIFIYLYLYLYTRRNMCMCMYACMYVCMYVRIRFCIHVFTCILHVYTRICGYEYICIYV